MKPIEIFSPQDVMEELEKAITNGDKKAVASIERNIKKKYLEMEKRGLMQPFGMEWFYSMVSPELWSHNETD